MQDLSKLDQYRLSNAKVLALYGSFGDSTWGCFELPFVTTKATLAIIASSDGGWDHVSVSLPNRCPTWPEMSYVKRRFFLPSETVMQLHPPETDYVNIHPFCLHLWRPQTATIPLPPKKFV